MYPGRKGGVLAGNGMEKSGEGGMRGEKNLDGEGRGGWGRWRNRLKIWWETDEW